MVIRLTKVLYVDYRNFGKIGEQQFYVLPDFQKAQLSDIYESQVRAQNREGNTLSLDALTHVKVRYIRTDIE